MKRQKGFTSVEIIVIVIFLIILIGWIKNIVKLSNCDFEAPYKAEVIHTVGLIPPVGAITGWLNVGQ